MFRAARPNLAILLYGRTLSVADLKRQLGITDGNLDAHLKKLASSGYLESHMVLEGPSDELLENPEVKKAYLGG